MSLSGPIATLIDGRARDLGGFFVARLLPSKAMRSVGPFVFFDHMGPAAFAPGTGIDVRPHPHIGLATVTYLFEGEIVHRDNLGFVQPIRPGAINWMTAGRGIAHSERTGDALRASGSRLHGLQLWVALPKAHEETEPAFVHHPAETLPELDAERVVLRVLAGRVYGRTSPVQTLSPLFYAEAKMPKGTTLAVPPEHVERAAFVVEGEVECDGERIAAPRMLVFARAAQSMLSATTDAHVMLLGGDPLDGERHLWWNFVSSSRERIEQAKRDWAEDRFAPIPGETERIPLPDF
jgi:redox-sensitive bicupin YhaK (pirin superfamily)